MHDAIDWYKSLTPHQRIFVREMYSAVTGLPFELSLFNLKQRIYMFYRKCMDIIINKEVACTESI